MWLRLQLRFGLVATALLLGTAAAAAAPEDTGSAEVEITGRVIEAVSERPLEGARITCAGRETVSDAEGRFRLVVPRGTQALVAEAEGHVPDGLSLEIGSRPPPEIEILLVERDRFAESVVVTAEVDDEAAPPPLRARPIDVMSQAGVVDNVFRSLQTLAGVAATNEFDSRLSVRGGGPDQNLTVMDGVEIHNPYRLFGLTSAFNPETVSDFELSTGAAPVRWGDRLSSVLDVRNRPGTQERDLAGSASMSLTDANLVLEGKLPGSAPGSWLVTGRRTYYDLVAERIVDDDLPSFGDLQAKVWRELRPGQRLTFTGLLSREGTDGSFTDDEDPLERADVLTSARNDLVSLAFQTPVGASGSARTVASWYRFVDSIDFDGTLESDYKVSNTADEARRYGYADIVFRRDVEIEDLSLRQEFLLVPSSRHLVDFGVELHDLDTRWGWEIPGERNPLAGNGSSVQGGAGLPDLLDSRVASTRFGAWLSDRFRASSSLTLEGGVRLDHSTLNDRTTLSPRLSARVDLTPSTRLRAAFGIHTQSPGYEKLFQSDYFVDLGVASGLAYERAQHWVLGVELEPAPGFQARVEGYYKRLSDLVVGRLETEEERLARVARYDFPDELSSSVPTDPEITSFPTNDSSGRAYGLDVYLAKSATGPATALTGWLSYTWGRAERDAYARRYPFDYDRRHSLNLVATWRLDRHFDLGVTGRYASGFPYTAARGVRAVAVEDPEREGVLIPERDPEGNLVWGVDPGGAANLNDSRLSAFARLDARLTFRPKGLSGRWLLYVEVINVTNRDNVAQVDYAIRFDPVTGQPFIGEVTQEGGIPLLPTFGVRFRW